MIFFNRNILLFFLVSLFISCDSKNTTSFKDLRNAFVQWNQKNHIDKNFDFTHNYFKRFNINLIEQYVEDLKRFDLELSQINLNNLANDLKTDYFIINNKISNYLFEIQIYDLTKYEAIFFIENIFISIDLLINMDIEFYSKIQLLDSHLKNVSSFIRDYKKIVYFTEESQKSVFNKKIIALISFIDEIPTNLNLVNDDYSQIQANINEIIISLNEMNYWLKYDYEFINLENNYISNFDKYNFAIKNLFENNEYDYESVVNFIETNIKTVQLKLINESILIYKQSNDEPVWVDRSDTVNVISWVKSNKLNNVSIPKENYLQEFENAYKLIDDNINQLDLNNYFELAPVFKENIHHDIIDDFLYSNNRNVYTINIAKSIPYSNKYQFNDIVFKQIIPEYNIKNTFYKNANVIRHLTDPINNKGFSLFLENILVLNNYTKDSLYKINFYINLLEKYSIVLSQNDLFVNGYSEDKIIDNVSIDNFISIDESKNILKNINKNEFYIGEVMVFLHLLNLYEDKCVISASMTLNEYIDSILSKGNIPFYLIN
jgi:hypothetical protein